MKKNSLYIILSQKSDDVLGIWNSCYKCTSRLKKTMSIVFKFHHNNLWNGFIWTKKITQEVEIALASMGTWVRNPMTQDKVRLWSTSFLSTCAYTSAIEVTGEGQTEAYRPSRLLYSCTHNRKILNKDEGWRTQLFLWPPQALHSSYTQFCPPAHTTF